MDLNPKFAVAKRLSTVEMQEDKELCLAKIRYEAHKIENIRKEIEKEETDYGYVSQRKKRKIEEELSRKEEEEEVIKDAKARQIFDPLKLEFDYTKRRVTDLKENNYVIYRKQLMNRQKEK